MIEVGSQVPDSSPERTDVAAQEMAPEVLDTMRNEGDRYDRMFASWKKRQAILATGHFSHVGEFSQGVAPAQTGFTGESWIFVDEQGQRIGEESFTATRLEQQEGVAFWEGQTQAGTWIRIEGKLKADSGAPSNPNTQIN
jgi:hypothetical protein